MKMTKKAFVVLGLGYGDEGKGLATDYLASQVEKPLVIRFNGGHQAGHTVTLLAGSKHVFSHFGAGTLRHVPTLWSRFCTFSPAYFLYEYDTLPVIPIIFVDKLCPVTTHYDVLFNRYQEDTRGKGRLGSCGVGFGATIRRHHTDNLCLSVEELFKPHVLRKKLSEIRSYYRQYFHSATQCNFDSFKHDTEDEQLFAYVEELAVLVNNGVIQLVDEKSILKSPKWSSHIYEGAQGILLDKEFGHQPFITQSNTTSKNALDLIKRNTDISTNDISLYYVTRSYLTRHGGGPFSKLPLEYELHNIETETNINNSYQGEFKRGFLNLNLMDYAIRSDKTFSRGINKNLLITCLDQLPTDEMYFSFEGKIDSVHFTDFYKKFLIKFNSVLYSFNPYSDAISKVEL